MPSAADRNLLFGILALQLDFITREQLIAGMNAWVLAKDRSLAELLEESGALATGRRKLLDPLVDEHIQQHGGDPQQSLAATMSTANLQAELSLIADPQLAESLQPLSQGSATGADQNFATISTGATPAPGMRFRILRPHAQGGLGTVSVAKDEELNREVALKEIQPKYADDQAARARFLLEAEVTGGLEHPSIVPVYGLGSYPDGRPYYAMRFIKGDSLKDVADRFHRAANEKTPGELAVELRQILGRFIDVCQAMEYAHSRGVLHRDIKPQNIMLGDYGETLVVDWGLAKAKGQGNEPVSASSERALAPAVSGSFEPTQMGAMIGTLHYMSPEQAAGRLDLLGPAADIYSLGATLYYLLTGKPSIQSQPLDDILKEIQRGDFPRPSAINPAVPKPLEAICLKAMSVAPANRYPSAQELASDLERWLADEPVRVHHESPFDRIARWMRRHRAWVRAISAAALAIIVVLVIAVVLINGQRQEADTQRKNAEALAKKNGELAARETELRKNAEWTAANRSFEQSLLRCQQVDATAGLLSLVEDLEEAQRIGATDLEQSIRAQIGRWTGAVHSLELARTHESSVVTLARSPNGETLFVGLVAKAMLQDAASGKPIGEPLAHTDRVQAAVFTPDGEVLITGSKDKTVRFWNARTAAAIGEPLVHEEEVDGLALSPDGTQMAIGSGNHIQLWHVATREKLEISFEHPDSISDVAFSPTEPLLLGASWDGTVQLWNLETKEAAGPSWKHTHAVLSVAFSPNGQRAVVCELANVARLWDVAAGNPVGVPLGHQGLVGHAAFSPDGNRLLTGSADQSARLWDVSTSEQIGPPARHSHIVNAVVWDPSGESFWSGSGDGGLRKWQVADGKSTQIPLKGNGNVLAAAFNRESSALHMLVGGLKAGDVEVPGELRSWDVPDAKPLKNARKNNHWTTIAAFSASGEKFVARSNDGALQVWDVATGESIGSEIEMSGSDFKAVAFSSDDTQLLVGTEDGQLLRRRIATGVRVGEKIKLAGRVSSVAFFSDDNDTFIAGCWDQKVYFQRVVFGSVEQSTLVTAVATRLDGRQFAAGAADGAIRLWDAFSRNQSGPVLKHHARVARLTYGPDGQFLAASYVDGSTRLWDLRSATVIGTPLEQSKEITALAISPDGKWLATASADWTARLWNTGPANGTAAEVKRHCEALTSVRLTDDDSLEVMSLEEWQRLKEEVP